MPIQQLTLYCTPSSFQVLPDLAEKGKHRPEKTAQSQGWEIGNSLTNENTGASDLTM